MWVYKSPVAAAVVFVFVVNTVLSFDFVRTEHWHEQKCHFCM